MYNQVAVKQTVVHYVVATSVDIAPFTFLMS